MNSNNNINNLDIVHEELTSEIQSSKMQTPMQQNLKNIEFFEKENEEEKKEIEKDENSTNNINTDINNNNVNTNNNDHLNEVEQLKKEIENEKINHIYNLRELNNKLNSQNIYVKNLSLKNSNLRASLQNLNYQMDKIIKKSASSRIALLNPIIKPAKSLEIINCELKNSKKLSEILLKDNKRIKKLIQYQTQITTDELDIKIKKKNEENLELKKEIKDLKNIQISHLRCNSEKLNLQNKIKELESDIVRQRVVSNKIKDTFENLENINQKSTLAYNQFVENIKQRKIEENRKLKTIKKKISDNNIDLNYIKNDNKINEIKKEITSFTEEEINIMEKYYNDKNRFNDFLVKVFNIEKYLKNRKKEIEEIDKEKNLKHTEINNQINILNKNIKDKETMIQNYETQILDYRNSKVILEKKLTNIKKTINSNLIKIQNIEKQSSDLFTEINCLKTMLNDKKCDPSIENQINNILKKEEGNKYEEKEKK